MGVGPSGECENWQAFCCVGVSLRSRLFHILDLFIKSLRLSVGALIRNSMVRIDSQYGILFSQHTAVNVLYKWQVIKNNWLLAGLTGVWVYLIWKKIFLILLVILYYHIYWTLTKRSSWPVFVGHHPSWNPRDVVANMTEHRPFVSVLQENRTIALKVPVNLPFKDHDTECLCGEFSMIKIFKVFQTHTEVEK